ncbi:MAG TPA: hypothetical protein VF006_10030 [Longimicrobium sp.]
MAEPERTDLFEWKGKRIAEPTPEGLRHYELSLLPEGTVIQNVFESFPPCTLWREGEEIVVEFEYWIFTDDWDHKYTAPFFIDAMARAVVRLSHEGYSLSAPEKIPVPPGFNRGEQYTIKWILRVPIHLGTDRILDAVQGVFNLVWRRAGDMLDNSHSVLVLGPDTGESLEKLRAIASCLEDLGYFPYLVKEQPDRPGETVLQKVLRFALSSRFVIVENTEPSGHLYELPHVAKAAECITVVLQQEGHGATWMFEDGYARHRHWHRIDYRPDELDHAVRRGVAWAEEFFRDFARYQQQHLPWLQGLGASGESAARGYAAGPEPLPGG